MCIDDKGLYWETLSEMAVHFNRQNDFILLQVKPEDAGSDWKPTHSYNLTSDRGIPFSIYAKFCVDTASSLGQQGDKGFFKNQAHTHIAAALELLYEIRADVTLENVYHLLLDQRDMEEALRDLAGGHPTERRRQLADHFRNRFMSQPPEQIGGVKETIANYLQYFLTPDIAQVFCPAENTFDFADIDRGKIICVAMPQKFQAERRYVNTFLKMLFYTHVLRRFDQPKNERRDANLLILWADEAQRFMTASEDGMSDYNCVDVIREAHATVVAAAQSSTSFIPPLGREKARVLTLNLRNRMIFKAADEEGAIESADFLGKREVIKRTWGFSYGRTTSNFSKHEEHKIKPYMLRGLPKHTAVLVHCERGLSPRSASAVRAEWDSQSVVPRRLVLANEPNREKASQHLNSPQRRFCKSLIVSLKRHVPENSFGKIGAMTELERPIKRRSRLPFGHYRKRMIVMLHPGDKIAMRLEKSRTWYWAELDDVFRILAQWHATRERALKCQEREARRGK